MERTKMWPAVLFFGLAAAIGALAFTTDTLRWLTVLALGLVLAGGAFFYRSLQRT